VQPVVQQRHVGERRLGAVQVRSKALPRPWGRLFRLMLHPPWTLYTLCSKLEPVESPETTIKIYNRRNEAGEIVSWYATIKIPGTSMWADVRRDQPIDCYGSIYETKAEAIEGAKREIIRRGGRPQT
jgi:hypothetical protein